MLRVIVAGVVVAGLGCALAVAHTGASGIVLERMELMKSVAGSMKEIAKTLKSQNPDNDLVVEASKNISEQTLHMPHMFPEGSFDAPSEASLKILQNRDDFDKQTVNMKLSAEALAGLASQNASFQDLQSGFDKLAGTCKECHKQYREKR